MTGPAPTVLARSALAAGVVVALTLASLPGLVTAALGPFHAVVTVLRGAGHGLLSVEDGFVTATIVTAVTIPLPVLVAMAVPVSARRAVSLAATGVLALEGIAALRSDHPGATFTSLVSASAAGLLLGWLVFAPRRGRGACATPRSRRVATWLIVVYGVAVLLVGFTGSPVDAGVHPGILRALVAAHRLGVPDWFGYGALEFTANVLFFVPLGLLVVLLLGGRRWWVGAVAGLLVSTAIESGQALFLPARFASFDDVLANTSGAAIGALIGVAVLARAARHRNSRPGR
ncbi:VanZ family protein [Curtobacterium sp. ZW137]|uniref:VanZ family protein n=1 Tax=Curtobacterium sp. ZW137 TaxID=2485104 RepID=UPI000FBA7EEE|nr:VanZ family protein [Curtobacterium sp. ZW137]ROP65044.1 VanZ like protein [Curtobacterium sp. ZW137]